MSMSFVGNASGCEPLCENGKPYAVSVFQRKEDAQVKVCLLQYGKKS